MSPYGERGAELGSRYFGLHAIIVKEGYPDIWEKSTLILSPYRLMVGSVGFFPGQVKLVLSLIYRQQCALVPGKCVC